MDNLIKVHVVVITTDITVLSRALASFLWQTLPNKTLHIVNVWGESLPITFDLEACNEDIRVYNVKRDGYNPLMENVSDGLVTFFAPDLLYMPWHLNKMVTGWITCGKGAFGSVRGLTRSEEPAGNLVYTTNPTGLHNILFMARDMQKISPTDYGFLHVLRNLDIQDDICTAEPSECPSIFYQQGPITKRKELPGLHLVNYDLERREFESVLNNGIIVLDELTPKDQQGKPIPHEMTTRNQLEIAEVKKWVPRTLACVCVISDDTYHTWQALVMLNNFRRFGYSSSVRLLVYHQFSHPSPILIKALEYFPEVQVFYYKDQGADMAAYKSVMRPHTLKRHWEQFPELKHAAVFYHDADIIFTKDPELHKLTVGPNCYTGDTVGYIGASSYLTHSDMGEHGRELLEQMAGVVGIDPDELLKRDHMSGGAQYIIKDVDAKYWAKVEKDCVLLNLCMQRLNRDMLNPSTPEAKRAKGELTHVQPWCADMWAVLWNLWLLGKKTPISANISHSWGTDPIEKWTSYPIHHNAGVTLTDEQRHRIFAKWKYVDRWPESLDLKDFNERFCSFNYAREIRTFFKTFKRQKKE